MQHITESEGVKYNQNSNNSNEDSLEFTPRLKKTLKKNGTNHQNHKKFSHFGGQNAFDIDSRQINSNTGNMELNSSRNESFARSNVCVRSERSNIDSIRNFEEPKYNEFSNHCNEPSFNFNDGQMQCNSRNSKLTSTNNERINKYKHYTKSKQHDSNDIHYQRGYNPYFNNNRSDTCDNTYKSGEILQKERKLPHEGENYFYKTNGRYNNFNCSNKISSNSLDTFRGNNKGYQNNVLNKKSVNYENKGKMESKYSNSNGIERQNNKIARYSNIDTTNYDQRDILIYELNVNKYECMICMAIIRKESPTWSCNTCFHIFHLHCINKWAISSDVKENKTDKNSDWTCPACKTQNQNIKTNKLVYSCFCGKQSDPVFRQGTTPHSCGDVCSQINKVNSKCAHLCSIQCHPGPCPPCEASVTRQCHCGRTKITARCIADETQFQCQSICERTMQCGLHKCDKPCHVDNDGHKCQIKIEQICWCGSSNRSVLCGSIDSMVKSYECENVCGRIKNCGNHKCEWSCHEGDCEECELMPNKVNSCYCGKKIFDQLHLDRQSCLDPIPSCNEVCGKKYPRCEHSCTNICHDGPCEVCPKTSTTKCLCQRSDQMVNCASNEVVMCKQRCKEKLLCGRHRCDKQCCDSEVHVCLMECGRQLSCKEHRCDRECGHSGSCPSCQNVSFEELFCECGVSFSLPPIACGQVAPLCTRPCSRDHPCEHPVRHNCHTESVCPPCTELVIKPCPGGHTEYANVPCFRPVVTCGLVCRKPLSNCSHTCLKQCYIGACVDTNEESCKQLCTKPRSECGHPCNATCHQGECVTDKCEAEVTLLCKCALRSKSITCTKLESYKASDVLLAAHNLYLMTETEQVLLECDKSCDQAVVRAAKFTQIYISSDNKSSDRVAIDSTLSCTVRCSGACHNSTMGTGAATRQCNNSSYQGVQRYYATYFEEFTRLNFKFVVMVERVFRDFQGALQSRESDKCRHNFLSMSVDKAQFIRRLSTAFRVQCLSASNDDGTVNVVVTAHPTTFCCPIMSLTKKVEEKYFNKF